MEEENMSVEQPEMETQEVAQSTESTTAQEERQDQQEEKRRKDADHNFAEMRRIKSDLERQIKERDDFIQKMQQQMFPQKQEVDEIDKLADDDIITKAHARRMAERAAKEAAKIAAEEAKKQLLAETYEDKLKARHPDFNEVVTQENIDKLKQLEPELAYSLSMNPDPYAQAVAVYKAIKMVGGATQKPPIEKEKAIKNSQKPVSVNAVTKQSAIGNAHLFENGLTPDLKKQLWQEMQDAMKRG